VTQFNRLVCPIDFSDCSRHALDHAAAIARWYESELAVLHVFTDREPVDMIPALGGRPLRPPVRPSLDRRQRVARDLHRFVMGSDVKGLDIEEIVQEAPDVATEILAQGAVRRADLLVLGSHGRSGMQRLILGSITEQILRSSEIPTLVVPPRADRVAFGHAAPFKRIVCPIDFSRSSRDALTYAMSLAEEGDANLTILHVIDAAPELVEAAMFTQAPLAKIRAKVAASYDERLMTLVPPSVRASCTVETMVADGRAASEILRVADDRRADLIVMGVHGRGAIDLMLFRSTTNEVIRAGQHPVLTVRGSATRSIARKPSRSTWLAS
jgi:nucleotide-binding universal stress UspA family protein